MPTVSVVIPVYNRPAELQAAVHSVIAQPAEGVEIIVVDDGSPMDLRAACPVLAHSQVRYIRQPNQGPAVARNTGLAEARGAFVALLDSDDVLLPDCLPTLRAQFDRNPRADVVHGWAVFHGPQAPDLQYHRVRLCGRDYPALLYSNVISMGTVLMRHGCWAAIGGFDAELPIFEDWDFWLRLSFHCQFDHVPEVVARISIQEVRRNTSQPSGRVGATVRQIYAKLLQDPTAGPLVRPLARRLEANAHVMTGHQYRVFESNYPAARREFLRAIQVAPGFGLAYLGLLEVLAGQRLINWLRQARSNIYRRRP